MFLSLSLVLRIQRRRDRLASVKAVLHQAALLVEVEAQIEAAATSGAFDSAIVLAVEAQDALGSHAIYDNEEDDRDTLAGSAEEQSVARLKVRIFMSFCKTDSRGEWRNGST